MSESPLPAPGVDTIPKVAHWAKERYGQSPALVSEETSLDFNEYVDGATAVARALHARGVRKGDRVAIWAPNSVRYAVCALGVHLSGAVLVPINTRFKLLEAAQVLGDCSARFVFTVNDFLGRAYADELRNLLAASADALPHLQEVVCIDDKADGLGRFLNVPDADSPDLEIGPNDIATILFTSGTTGRAKGAMLTHSSLVRSYWSWSGLAGQRSGDRFLVTNPFFHAFGLMVGLLSALMRGSAVYPVAVFNPAEVMEIIQRERITYYPGPPTVFQEMLASPQFGSHDLSSLRGCVMGATSIPPALIDELFDRIGFEEVFIPYGFTEGTGIATITRAGDAREVLKSTAGRPLPDVDIEIRHPDGSAAGPGEVGEIAIHGYNVMPGYLDVEAGDLRREQPVRWLMSGDLGVFDDEGNLKVVGRLKDVIIVGGFNVYPAEVEAALAAYPGIDLVSVVGVPDEKFGEVPHAFVVTQVGAEVDVVSLQLWSRDRIANFKVPRVIHLIRALPMNASGKVVKSELRQLAVDSIQPGE